MEVCCQEICTLMEAYIYVFQKGQLMLFVITPDKAFFQPTSIESFLIRGVSNEYPQFMFS